MTTTIYVSAKALAISAKNNAFPKVADIMAIRMLRQSDFSRRELLLNPDGGFESKHVVEVQL